MYAAIMLQCNLNPPQLLLSEATTHGRLGSQLPALGSNHLYSFSEGAGLAATCSGDFGSVGSNFDSPRQHATVPPTILAWSRSGNTMGRLTDVLNDPDFRFCSPNFPPSSLKVEKNQKKPSPYKNGENHRKHYMLSSEYPKNLAQPEQRASRSSSSTANQEQESGGVNLPAADGQDTGKKESKGLQSVVQNNHSTRNTVIRGVEKDEKDDAMGMDNRTLPVLERKVKRRKRARESCGHCVLKKRKCEGGFPCKRCKKYNIPHLCNKKVFVPPSHCTLTPGCTRTDGFSHGGQCKRQRRQ